MGTGMKSLKWEGIGTKNLFPHTSTRHTLHLYYYVLFTAHKLNWTDHMQKGTTFPLWINLSIRNVIWPNLVFLLLVTIIIDVTYLVSWIYNNFHRLLCKKCDVGYYVINQGVMNWRLQFQFRHYYTKFLTHAKIKYTELSLIISLM